MFFCFETQAPNSFSLTSEPPPVAFGGKRRCSIARTTSLSLFPRHRSFSNKNNTRTQRERDRQACVQHKEQYLPHNIHNTYLELLLLSFFLLCIQLYTIRRKVREREREKNERERERACMLLCPSLCVESKIYGRQQAAAAARERRKTDSSVFSVKYDRKRW